MSAEDEATEEESDSGSESYSSSYEDGEERKDNTDEPVLKYSRFAEDVVNCLNPAQGETKNVIECMAVHSKFIAIGTYDGSIKMVDHSGNVLADREYTLHAGKINQISIDEEGEFMACCSDDGRVSVIGFVTSKYNNSVQFDRPIKSVAIHPHFGKPANRIFAAGSDKLQLVEERRWPLIGHKMLDISSQGTVYVIKWRDIYIAWANEKVVFVYDTILKDIITLIRFDEESITYLPSCLCWVKSGVLLVGKGHCVKVAKVKSDTTEMLDYSGGVDAMTKKKKCMLITAQNVFPDFIVCGVVPIVSNNDEWNMVVLGYDANVNQDEACMKGGVPPPRLIVIPPGTYDTVNEDFLSVTEISRDKLLPRGYSYCKAQEYHLEFVITGNEDRFYVLTPIAIILAQKTTIDDHINWLIVKNKFKEAMLFVENPNNAKSLKYTKIKDTGIKYINHLIDIEDYAEAARKCCHVLGEKDATRWSDIIFDFIDKQQLKTIMPFIPKTNPKLSPAVYETVLNNFLLSNREVLLSTINEWPSDLYSQSVIMAAVEQELVASCNDMNLLKVKAKLHEDMDDPDSALKIYLRLGDTSEVFDLIRKRKLHVSLLENIQYLMKLGEEELQKTVELLVEFSGDYIPPSRVVKKIESFKSGRDDDYLLHRYLDTLFEKDPKAGSSYHEQQVSDCDQKKLQAKLSDKTVAGLQKELEESKSETTRYKTSHQQEQEHHQLTKQDYERSKSETTRYKTLYEQEQRDHQLTKDRISLKHTELEETASSYANSWKITHKDITLTPSELGRGGWGVITLGFFREQKVAVKQLYKIIMNESTLAVMHREINTMSRLRHPNLLLFIGAALDHPSGNPLIITELMDTSLRQAYEKNQITMSNTKLSVLRDTAAGLNYLHRHPDEIIHRDVSSANVLLESRGANKWRAKLSDFGSANIARNAFTQAPGAAIYSAPESLATVAITSKRPHQTTKMDVFSFGVLMCEVMTSRFPDMDKFQDMLQTVTDRSPPIGKLIKSCISEQPKNRPTMIQVIKQIDNYMKQ